MFLDQHFPRAEKIHKQSGARDLISLYGQRDWNERRDRTGGLLRVLVNAKNRSQRPQQGYHLTLPSFNEVLRTLYLGEEPSLPLGLVHYAPAVLLDFMSKVRQADDYGLGEDLTGDERAFSFSGEEFLRFLILGYDVKPEIAHRLYTTCLARLPGCSPDRMDLSLAVNAMVVDLLEDHGRSVKKPKGSWPNFQAQPEGFINGMRQWQTLQTMALAKLDMQRRFPVDPISGITQQPDLRAGNVTLQPEWHAMLGDIFNDVGPMQQKGLLPTLPPYREIEYTGPWYRPEDQVSYPNPETPPFSPDTSDLGAEFDDISDYNDDLEDVEDLDEELPAAEEEDDTTGPESPEAQAWKLTPSWTPTKREDLEIAVRLWSQNEAVVLRMVPGVFRNKLLNRAMAFFKKLSAQDILRFKNAGCYLNLKRLLSRSARVELNGANDQIDARWKQIEPLDADGADLSDRLKAATPTVMTRSITVEHVAHSEQEDRQTNQRQIRNSGDGSAEPRHAEDQELLRPSEARGSRGKSRTGAKKEPDNLSPSQQKGGSTGAGLSSADSRGTDIFGYLSDEELPLPTFDSRSVPNKRTSKKVPDIFIIKDEDCSGDEDSNPNMEWRFTEQRVDLDRDDDGTSDLPDFTPEKLAVFHSLHQPVPIGSETARDWKPVNFEKLSRAVKTWSQQPSTLEVLFWEDRHVLLENCVRFYNKLGRAQRLQSKVQTLRGLLTSLVNRHKEAPKNSETQQLSDWRQCVPKLMSGKSVDFVLKALAEIETNESPTVTTEETATPREQATATRPREAETTTPQEEASVVRPQETATKSQDPALALGQSQISTQTSDIRTAETLETSTKRSPGQKGSKALTGPPGAEHLQPSGSDPASALASLDLVSNAGFGSATHIRAANKKLRGWKPTVNELPGIITAWYGDTTNLRALPFELRHLMLVISIDVAHRLESSDMHKKVYIWLCRLNDAHLNGRKNRLGHQLARDWQSQDRIESPVTLDELLDAAINDFDDAKRGDASSAMDWMVPGHWLPNILDGMPISWTFKNSRIECVNLPLMLGAYWSDTSLLRNIPAADREGLLAIISRQVSLERFSYEQDRMHVLVSALLLRHQQAPHSDDHDTCISSDWRKLEKLPPGAETVAQRIKRALSAREDPSTIPLGAPMDFPRSNGYKNAAASFVAGQLKSQPNVTGEQMNADKTASHDGLPCQTHSKEPDGQNAIGSASSGARTADVYPSSAQDWRPLSIPTLLAAITRWDDDSQPLRVIPSESRAALLRTSAETLLQLSPEDRASEPIAKSLEILHRLHELHSKAPQNSADQKLNHNWTKTRSYADNDSVEDRITRAMPPSAPVGSGLPKMPISLPGLSTKPLTAAQPLATHGSHKGPSGMRPDSLPDRAQPTAPEPRSDRAGCSPHPDFDYRHWTFGEDTITAASTALPMKGSGNKSKPDLQSRALSRYFAFYGVLDRKNLPPAHYQEDYTIAQLYYLVHREGLPLHSLHEMWPETFTPKGWIHAHRVPFGRPGIVLRDEKFFYLQVCGCYLLVGSGKAKSMWGKKIFQGSIDIEAPPWLSSTEAPSKWVARQDNDACRIEAYEDMEFDLDLVEFPVEIDGGRMSTNWRNAIHQVAEQDDVDPSIVDFSLTLRSQEESGVLEQGANDSLFQAPVGFGQDMLSISIEAFQGRVRAMANKKMPMNLKRREQYERQAAISHELQQAMTSTVQDSSEIIARTVAFDMALSQHMFRAQQEIKDAMRAAALSAEGTTRVFNEHIEQTQASVGAALGIDLRPTQALGFTGRPLTDNDYKLWLRKSRLREPKESVYGMPKYLGANIEESEDLISVQWQAPTSTAARELDRDRGTSNNNKKRSIIEDDDEPPAYGRQGQGTEADTSHDPPAKKRQRTQEEKINGEMEVDSDAEAEQENDNSANDQAASESDSAFDSG